MSFNTQLNILYQLAQAIKFLKDNKIIHLDLKPLNIMFNEKMELKLIDFGGSNIFLNNSNLGGQYE